MTSPVFDLCDDFVTRSAQLDPIFATMRGIAGPTADVATDFSPDGVAARADLVDSTLRQLDALTPTGDDDRLAAAHFANGFRSNMTRTRSMSRCATCGRRSASSIRCATAST